MNPYEEMMRQFQWNPSYGMPNIPPPAMFNYTPMTSYAPFDMTYRGDGTMRLFPESMIDPSSFSEKDARMMWESYSGNVMQPYINFLLQADAQRYNQAYNAQALGLQAWANIMENELAYRGADREDRAMAMSERFNVRDFEESVRRFDAEQAYARDRLGLDRDLGMGRLGLDRELGMGRLGLDRELGMGQLALGRDRLGLERELGMGQLGLSRDRLGLERELGMGQLGIDRDRLGLDTRRFEADDKFRYSQLQQEADLMRERMANEMTQSRYQAFGRSQAPQFRQMASWR